MVFYDLSELEFCAINSKKMSRKKVSFELPPYLAVDDFDEVPEEIMVSWKNQERNMLRKSKSHTRV